MLKNYFKSAIRNLIKFKQYTIINVAGLAIALVTAMTIFSWIYHELSYDTFHEESDKIYRLAISGDFEAYASLSPATKPELLDKVPEIKHSVRLLNADFIGGKTKVAHGEKVFTNHRIIYADKGFFKIFTFPLINGEPETALSKPNAVIITEETANKYFGNANPIGKSLIISDKTSLEITGVFKSLPTNSHFHFDLLVNMESNPLGDLNRIGLGSGYIFYNYVKLHDQVPPHVVITKLYTLLDNLNLSWDWNPTFIFQPITDIHLYSNGFRELEKNGNIRMIYIFISIGILVLLTAGINYINMSTAQSFRRSKEVGIRKTLGADRKQLITIFLIESLVVALIGFILAIILHQILKPTILYITGTYQIVQIFSISNWFLLSLLFSILLGFVVGLFPAFFISRSRPSGIIQSGFYSLPKKGDFRKILLSVQFCISIVLIFTTIIIYNQMQYTQNRDLGYKKDQILILHVGYPGLLEKLELFKQSVNQHPDILNATATSQIPSNITTGEGVNLPDGERIEAEYISIDKDFFKTLSLNIIEGEERINLVNPATYDQRKYIRNQYIINREFLNRMQVDPGDAINQEILVRHGNMVPGPIIGVVDDFHYQSLHTPIGPLVLEFIPWDYQHLLIKLNTTNIKETIDFIKTQWQIYAGNLPFEYRFLDEEYNALYQTETRMGHLILIFSIISIIIGSIGLIGLSLFYSDRKTKEIGIRKVIGATIPNIFIQLIKDFAKWIVLANLIAWPIAWYVMDKWLQNFAYRIDLTIWPFLLAGLAALVIALLTISWQAIRAATANPVEALRYE